MTSSPGLSGRSHLHARRGVLQTTTDDDRRQRAKQYCPRYTVCRRASNNMNAPESDSVRRTLSDCHITSNMRELISRHFSGRRQTVDRNERVHPMYFCHRTFLRLIQIWRL